MKMVVKDNKKILAALVVVFAFGLSVTGLKLVSAMSNETAGHDTKTVSAPNTAKNSTDSTAAETEAAKETEKEAATALASSKKASEETKQTQAKETPKVTYPSIAAPSPRGKSLYVDASLKVGQPAEIASQPTATWLGEWSGDVRQSVNATVSKAAAQGTIASFVLYNIPARDCGSYSAGGASSSQSYRNWVRSVAAGIGNREAIVIVEPDALSQITCLSQADQENRYADIADAVNVLATQTKSFIYLDAGNGSWIDANTMVGRLEKANIAQARGFSMNVSGFQSTQSTIQYGEKISSKNKKSYVIDTSRNGQGPNGGEWCNPRGRGLGKKPTTSTSGYLDAYLWVKVPGESDGECNGGPSAGTWWDEYAKELIANAVY